MADEDDFDEDVIIPNSPLSQYLQGLENSEASNLIDHTAVMQNVSQECNKVSLETKPPAFSQKANLLRHSKLLLHVVGSLFHLPYYIVLCASLLSCSFLRFNLTIEKELLIPEDYGFLKSLLKSENVNKWPPVRKILRIWTLLTIAFLIFHYSTVTNKGLVDLCYVCYLITCLYAMLSFLSGCLVMYCIVLDKHLNSFYLRTSKILNLIKQSIRLVQESELTARGFTTASSIGAVERIELSSVLPFISSNKQCLRLRRFLFKRMKDLFLCYKSQTLNLIQNVPLDPLYDFSTSLAQLEIDEFGAFLTCDLDSLEISKLTDGFSISSLKTMYRLMEMQISEYFRSTMVMLFFITDIKRKDCCEQIWDLYHIQTAMNVLSKTSKPLFLEIDKTYHFYQSIEASYVNDSVSKSPRHVKTPVSKLKVTVHNMCLHLKATMLRAIEIENRLVSVSDSSSTEALKSVDSLLQAVNNELLAFHDCSKESTEIVYDLLHPQKKDTLETILPTAKEQAGSNDVPKVLEKCDVEREIEDEVFEGMILTSETKSGRSDSMSCLTEDSIKNIEISAHLLSELKNVLVPKVDEHRVRELKALAKKSKDIGFFDCEDQVTEDAQSLLPDSISSICDIKKEESDSQIKFESHLDEDDSNLESLPHRSEENLSDSLMSDIPMSFPNPFLKPNDSFAASIASLAAHRQKMLGLSSDEYVVEGSDYSDSD